MQECRRYLKIDFYFFAFFVGKLHWYSLPMSKESNVIQSGDEHGHLRHFSFLVAVFAVIIVPDRQKCNIHDDGQW